MCSACGLKARQSPKPAAAAAFWKRVTRQSTISRWATSGLEPTEPFRGLRGFIAFYASRVDECWVGNERVRPQEGDFYGGWITSKIVGPFKGGPERFDW